MNNYLQVSTYLDSFVDYEQKAFFPYQRTFKLARVRALIRALAIAVEKLAVVHIAGTKGKGSTAAFCAHMLAAGGARVGLYTSPHFFDFRERIQILGRGISRRPSSVVRRPSEYGLRNTNGGIRTTITSEMIAERDVARLVRKIRPRLEAVRFNRKLGAVSFFEVYTALAFMYFLEQKVDYVVLETGLGGRLDATNVVTPLVSVITRIGLDHTDKLGTTVSAIAREKAGIIKRDAPVICAAQTPRAAIVIRKRARSSAAPLFIYGRDFNASGVTYRNTMTNFDFSFGAKKISRCAVSLVGFHQVENASLALAAVEVLRRKGFSASDESLYAGLRAAYIPGRFEVLQRKPLVVADIAHNPLAFDAVARNLKLYFPDKKIMLIFAASRDKDVCAMINKIKSRYTILTSFDNPRAFSPLEIKMRCGLRDACCVASVKQAYAVAAQQADQHSLILISGSLFLVAEAKKFFEVGR